jgi:26S proteasome regulatory subunit N7
MDLAFTDQAKKHRGPSKEWTEREIEEELKKFDQKIEEAKEQAGDVEVRDAILDKALFLKDEARDYPEAERVFRDAYAKSGGASKKMEILFEIMLMNIEKFDIDALKKDVNTCKSLVEEGADWDKKNKLKIFEGVYCMLIRDLNRAAELFLSSIATFTCVELMSYRDFVFYTVVTAMVTQDRKTIRKEVVHSPDILAVIRDIPFLRQYLESFYNCDYQSFFEAFVEIIDAIKADKYLQTHANYFIKEMRLVAYRQYLESFKSVTIANMARSFGVSPDFLDRELSNFIYIGKINCKIDRVSGVIETNRPNKKADLFGQVVKQGDTLLNRVQKLARALDI